MRLRIFHASGMTEAMALVRIELGPDAVILSNRRTATGVEVTAALEGDEPLLIPPEPLAAPFAVPDAALARHNLPPALAGRLRGPLAPALAAALPFAPLPDAGARGIALVGPPGAGKTLTCAKLATRLVLAGKSPVVVTADAARAGAAEQLAAFTRLLGLTLAVAASPAQVARALHRRQPGQPVLLDTAGCDPFDGKQAEALLALLRAADAAPVLVLPAGLDAAEAAELARAFAALGARCMIPTRLDSARRLGSVLAAAEAGPLALSEAGTGPGAADGLTPLTPDWLAARLCPPVSQDVAA
ncbi:GTP-binding protein [Roseomonas sp. BN140053]|uniref:flagellar biosynthesis protein FlhF n=1 Tax=Roseomonas sp. BN140053 TaxID=3391898 RepID=UPI0039ED22E4